ncbi:AAA family ATPase [Streptomyces sp. NPDC051907]|uniref:AAA family ATPase n=1 Tax=Streptomyces sp. NPDC051907 TaxID=3155284 RepID=UPI003439560A
MGDPLGYTTTDAEAEFALVGRERELGLLSSVIARLPAVAFVEGEAGVGKSRLVHEAAKSLRKRDVRVLVGYCHPLREPLPFGPVLEALTAAGDWLPSPEALNPQAGALSSLLPGLADRLPPAPEAFLDPRSSRFQVLGAVRSVLEAVAPAILIVEDLHWADEHTRELVLWLARHMPKNLGLVLTYRDEDLPSGTPVLGAPYRRPPDTNGAEIHLQPLAEPHVQELVRTVLGAKATRTLVKTVYSRSAGLPLIVEEDLLTIADWERGGRPGSDEAWNADAGVAVLGSKVPRALREAMVTRMAGLSPSACALAQAAAVLTVPATSHTLGEVAGMEPEEATEALAACLRAAVLRETSPATYGFRHTLAQQAVYWDILGPLREDLHRRAHRVLQAQPVPPLVQIAHHTYALGDTAVWLGEAEAAADQALTMGDDGTAVALLHSILKEPRLDPGLRSRVALALARIAHYSVDYSAGAAALRRVVTVPELEQETRGQLRLALGLFMINQQGDERGFAELKRSVEELGARTDLSVRAMVALARGEPHLSAEEALQWMDRAEHAAFHVHGASATAAVWATRLDRMALDGDEVVWELIDQLPRYSEDREVMRQYLRALNNVGLAAMERGLDQRASDLLTECRDLSQQSGFHTMEYFSRSASLILDWLGGRWSGLEEAFVRLGAEAPDMAPVTKAAALVRGNLAAARGQWARALDEFDRAARMEEQFAEAGDVLSAVAGRTKVLLAQGEPAAAWAAVEPAVEPLPVAPRPWATGLLPMAVRAALSCGLHSTAQRLTTAVEDSIRGKDSPAVVAVLHLAHGMIREHQGELEAAAEHFDLAHVHYRAIGRPYHAAAAHELLARTLMPSAPHEAGRKLTEIADAYTALGASADAARCQLSLREKGLARPAPRGRRGYGPDLSPREKQVAHLLADGASNHEIATALSLSVRTVEHHVARVLKKLDVPRDALITRPSGVPRRDVSG